jgi:AbrB family looped-hinge helix DNA binding protein
MKTQIRVGSTGMTRRLDELGRIVIPKEIRDNLEMPEGTSLEFLIIDGGIIALRKFVVIDPCEECPGKEYKARVAT